MTRARENLVSRDVLDSTELVSAAKSCHVHPLCT